jgi:hypothetical protein
MPTLGALVRERLQPFAASHRILLYVVCSILALAITTFNALRDHSNFYSVAIHLSRSSRSLLVRFALYPASMCAQLRAPRCWPIQACAPRSSAVRSYRVYSSDRCCLRR